MGMDWSKVDWMMVAWCVAGFVFFLELALAWAHRKDAHDGKVDHPWLAKAAYWVHKVASYALLIPDMLSPIGIKPQVPVLAAIKRYKELSSKIHVDDLPLEPWEQREPRK